MSGGGAGGGSGATRDNWFSRVKAFILHPASSAWANAIIVGVGLIYAAQQVKFAGGQLRASIEAQYGNTMYNTEKDYKSLLDSTRDPQFTTCYDQKGASTLPAPCPSKAAQQIFFNLISFLQLLYDLQRLHSLDASYVAVKTQRACLYVHSPSGKYTIGDFKAFFSADFLQYLSTTCGS